MAKCEKFTEKIFDYVDSLIPADKRKEVQGHLEECPECRSVFDDAQAARKQLHSLKRVKTSPDFDTVLRARIRMEKSLTRWGRLDWPLRLPIYAVAGSLAVITAFFILSDFENNSRANFNNPQVISQPYTQASSNALSNVSAAPREQVVFPMDKISPLLGKGTPLNSDELQRTSNAGEDSVLGVPNRAIQSVEFEIEF